jgi:hypothetical protein
MVTEKPVEKFRKDYTPTPYLVETIDLNFILNEDVSTVEARLRLIPNHKATNGNRPELFLDGAAWLWLAAHMVADMQQYEGQLFVWWSTRKALLIGTHAIGALQRTIP